MVQLQITVKRLLGQNLLPPMFLKSFLWSTPLYLCRCFTRYVNLTILIVHFCGCYLQVVDYVILPCIDTRRYLSMPLQVSFFFYYPILFTYLPTILNLTSTTLRYSRKVHSPCSVSTLLYIPNYRPVITLLPCGTLRLCTF